jgi:hypothetical protein
MKDNKYYTIKRIEELQTQELIPSLYSDMFPEINQETEEEPGSGWYINIGNNKSDSYPIKIDNFLSILTDFKKKGANYVCVDYHTDNITYLLEGLNIQISNEEEIQLFEDKESEKDKKLEKYLKLKSEMIKLEKELRSE